MNETVYCSRKSDLENRLLGFSTITLKAENLNANYSEYFHYGNLILLKIWVQIGVDIPTYSQANIFTISNFFVVRGVRLIYPIHFQDKASQLWAAVNLENNATNISIMTKGAPVSKNDWILGSILIPIAV